MNIAVQITIVPVSQYENGFRVPMRAKLDSIGYKEPSALSFYLNNKADVLPVGHERVMCSMCLGDVGELKSCLQFDNAETGETRYLCPDCAMRLQYRLGTEYSKAAAEKILSNTVQAMEQIAATSQEIPEGQKEKFNRGTQETKVEYVRPNIAKQYEDVVTRFLGLYLNRKTMIAPSGVNSAAVIEAFSNGFFNRFDKIPESKYSPNSISYEMHNDGVVVTVSENGVPKQLSEEQVLDRIRQLNRFIVSYNRDLIRFFYTKMNTTASVDLGSAMVSVLGAANCALQMSFPALIEVWQFAYAIVRIAYRDKMMLNALTGSESTTFDKKRLNDITRWNSLNIPYPVEILGYTNTNVIFASDMGERMVTQAQLRSNAMSLIDLASNIANSIM